jgi:hypothetical protein
LNRETSKRPRPLITRSSCLITLCGRQPTMVAAEHNKDVGLEVTCRYADLLQLRLLRPLRPLHLKRMKGICTFRTSARGQSSAEARSQCRYRRSQRTRATEGCSQTPRSRIGGSNQTAPAQFGSTAHQSMWDKPRAFGPYWATAINGASFSGMPLST